MAVTAQELDRIRKLFALADGTSYPAEAKAARRKAVALMRKHRIGAAQVRGASPFIRLKDQPSTAWPSPAPPGGWPPPPVRVHIVTYYTPAGPFGGNNPSSLRVDVGGRPAVIFNARFSRYVR